MRNVIQLIEMSLLGFDVLTAVIVEIYTGVYCYTFGARGSVVVKALYYKPDDRGFQTRWGVLLDLPNPSGSTRPWDLLSLYQERVPET
jgi:hypothetical protein